MTAETWQQVRAVFGIAVGLEEPERSGYLASVADEVRSEVESLLAAHFEAGGFLEEGAGAVPVDSHIGPYRILQKIGEGGMGAVYLAERDAGGFEQRVALKVISSALATEELDRRFLAERQTLARLVHPNIVRLLDGGEWEGRRYFAMEFVTGVPITEYCRALPLSQTLALFRTVCSAIHYAHQHLIVHRDIKPANILVTAEGDAKVLDFGIAKLLDSPAGGKTTRLQPMSLDCASPEQVKGLPITTATDVYSLGVLLYELLAEVSPQGGAGRTLDETVRRICDSTPERPSTLNPEIPQDLDSIVLRALQKDPQLRYASAEELSADIGRYLEARPVIAREATFRYVARKFVSRHKLAVTAALLGGIVLIAGVGVVFWESRVAARERARAERHFAEIRKLAGDLVFDLHDRIEKVPGALDAREALLARGIEYLDILAKDAGLDAGLLVEVSQAYRRLAGLQWDAAKPSRWNLDGAITTLEKAEVVARAATGVAPRSRESRMELLQVLVQRAGIAGSRAFVHRTQDEKVRSEVAGEALALARKLAKEFSGDVEIISELGSAQFSVAVTYEGVDQPRAIGAYRDALESFRRALALQSEDLARRESVARAARALGMALNGPGNFREAKTCLQEALEIDELLLARQPTDSMRGLRVTYDLSSLFTVAAHEGNWNEALPLAMRTVRMREEILRQDPSDRNTLLRLWFAYTNASAEAFVMLNRPTEALDSLARGRTIESSLPKGAVPEAWMARARYNEARAREILGNRTIACALFRESGELYASSPRASQDRKDDQQTQEGLKRCGLDAPDR